jgi:LPS-assembly protein
VVLLGEMTRFQSSREFLGLSNDNGQRMVSQAQVAQSWITPYGSVTPKLMLHARSYQFEQTLAATGARSASVVIPSYSVDAGAVFERPTQLFAKDWVQTLEPRIFYVNTPFKDQNNLPNYDSASYDFNIATIFTENAFTGYDRISDSHQVTTGATSRFLDPRSGAERARVVLAQRYRLRSQEVVLPGGTAATEQLSDTLAGTNLQLANAWSLDSALQYSPDAMRFVRSTVVGRYRPGPYQVLNMAYRYKADSVGAAGGEFVDTSWQWPLQNLFSGGGSADSDLGAAPGRWYTVGRLNYNQQESRLVDALVGFEYDAGCWLSRVAFDRYQLTADRSVQRVMFQMEFSGMSRVGSNITGVFKDYVPRYQNLRENGGFPSRFGQYE